MEQKLIGNVKILKVKPELKIWIACLTNQPATEKHINAFLSWFNNGKHKAAESLEDADVVVFTGGEDINPILYGEKPHVRTTFNEKRDLRELEDFRKAQRYEKFIIGICRGAQLSCVMAGGKLIQHVEGTFHSSQHYITDRISNTRYSMSSYHHQMMMPYLMKKEEYEIIAYADTSSSTRGMRAYYGEDSKRYYLNDVLLDKYPNFMEPEIVWFPKIKAFAIQGHPEWMSEANYTATVKYLNTTILSKYVNTNTKVTA